MTFIKGTLKEECFRVKAAEPRWKAWHTRKNDKQRG